MAQFNHSESETNAPDISQEPSSYVAIPLDAIPLDLSLPYSIFVKVVGQFILFRNRADRLTSLRAQGLSEKNVTTVFVKSEEWLAFLSSLETLEDAQPDFENSVTRLRHLLLAYGQELEKKKSLQRETYLKLHLLGERLAIAVKKDPALGGKLLRRYNDPSFYFVNHTVNVATYSAAVANKLKLPTEQIKLLTIAALVHNVGKLFIPKEILYKAGPLTKQEWDIMVTHPEKGADLLGDLQAPREIILTAIQHHERIEGGGYPSNLSGIEIHPFARICSIADVYDALTNCSPYQKALSPTDAIQKIVTMKGKFDPKILNMVTNV